MNLTPCLVAEVHEEVAGLLGGPVPGWMQRDAEDADAPSNVLDHGQDVGLSAVEQVDAEEVTGQDRVGLGAQELCPGRPGPRRGADAVVFADPAQARPRARLSGTVLKAGQHLCALTGQPFTVAAGPSRAADHRGCP
jgi:hypothetical protein